MTTLPSNSLYFSVVSLWEIAIKNALGRKDFTVNVSQLRHGLLTNGYIELALSSYHVMQVGHLATLHKDPFDRMLVAQSLAEQLTLITVDTWVSQYSSNILLV